MTISRTPDLPLAPGAGLPPGEGAFDDPAVLARFPALARFRARLGNTPLMKAPSPAGGAAILAKCEWRNPGGSVKARTAYAMMYRVLAAASEAQARRLKILEYSGGSLALALGGLCHELGVPARLVLSSATPPSVLARLAEWGVETTLVDKERGFIAVVQVAAALGESDPSLTFLYQHRNEANLRFHALTTGAEFLEQLRGRRVDAWLASIGTGGTLMGVLSALRREHPGVRAYGVTPAELPYGSFLPPNSKPKYSGSGGFGDGVKQPFVAAGEERLAGHFHYSYDEALAAMGEFFDATGERIGSSAAANWLAAREVAARLGPEANVVTVFPCAGTPEEWRRLGR